MSDVHRHHPELTEAEAERVQLLRTDMPYPAIGTVVRECPCGTLFRIDAKKADRGSKWYRLCPSCLQDEF